MHGCFFRRSALPVVLLRISFVPFDFGVVVGLRVLQGTRRDSAPRPAPPLPFLPLKVNDSVNLYANNQ
jgi:hypothetical protein